MCCSSVKPATGAAEPGWRRFHLTASDDGAALTEQVGAVAAERRVPLRELRRDTPTLERVFLDLIAQPRRQETEA